MIEKIVKVVVVAVILTGCTPAVNYKFKSAADVSTDTKIIRSEYDEGVRLMGPPIYSTEENGGPSDQITVRMGAQLDSGNRVLYRLIFVSVDYYTKSYRNYDSLSLVGGTRLPIYKALRNLSGCGTYWCSFTESVSFKVGSDLSINNGFRFRLNSMSGVSNELFVPYEYIRGFNDRLRSVVIGGANN